MDYKQLLLDEYAITEDKLQVVVTDANFKELTLNFPRWYLEELYQDLQTILKPEYKYIEIGAAPAVIDLLDAVPDNSTLETTNVVYTGGKICLRVEARPLSEETKQELIAEQLMELSLKLRKSYAQHRDAGLMFQSITQP